MHVYSKSEMTEIRIETTIESDGELHLRALPCRRGDRVSAIVTIASQSDEDQKEVSRQRFLTMARSSLFTSVNLYPTRDDLHARD